MRYKVATITLNPAYDLVGFCPKVALGDVNLVNTTGLHAAGKGINVAKVLRDLGLDITVSGFLGKENDDGFVQLFEQLKIDNQFQTVAGRTRINVKITEETGDVTDLNFSGFSITEQNWQQFAKDSLVWLKDFDMIAVSGSLPAGIELDAFTAWMSQLTKQCPRVVFDSSRDALIAGLKASPWLIKPNDKELEMWSGKSLTTLDDITNVAQQLVAQGIANVVVSLGSKGALWVTKDHVWLAKPPVCKVVSTVGAGDSMVAGLMYGLLGQKTIDETFRLASAVAALSVSQSNVGVPDKNALSAMIDNIELTAIK
ncbi:1-phosphofructokinase [Utexia brackfieldae]|uniref:1-phosphofructokinase n=1 Tax=Utexia brackfieldae TaxID=3074108 RepID=UPI00370DD98A